MLKLKINDQEFSAIASIVYDASGIKLSDGKQIMVSRRLTPRLRSLGMGSVAEYLKFIEQNGTTELDTLINLITTNYTTFFREPHHFEYMRRELITELMLKNARTKKIRIWCAASSTGEEPYSIAMTLLEAAPELARWDAKILATDIDTKVLSTASAGIYDYKQKKLGSLGDDTVKRWFIPGKGDNQGKYKVKDELRDLISFRPLNLLQNSWPMKGQFDIIFCRNVFIYFDKPTQADIMRRFSEHQKKDSVLFIGHSENISRLTDAYKLVHKTIYRKTR